MLPLIIQWSEWGLLSLSGWDIKWTFTWGDKYGVVCQYVSTGQVLLALFPVSDLLDFIRDIVFWNKLGLINVRKLFFLFIWLLVDIHTQKECFFPEDSVRGSLPVFDILGSLVIIKVAQVHRHTHLSTLPLSIAKLEVVHIMLPVQKFLGLFSKLWILITQTPAFSNQPCLLSVV